MLTGATRAHYRTLHDAAVLQAADDAAPAFIFVATGAEPRTVTRRHFRHAVSHHAALLRQKGITAGDLVIIAHTQNSESIFLFWAALLLGAIPSLFPTLTEKLDPEAYADNMATLVRLSGASAIFTTDDFASRLQAWVDCPVYGSVTEFDDHSTPYPSPQPPAPEAVAFLQHSSGTTGLQKGLALTHRAVPSPCGTAATAAFSTALLLMTCSPKCSA